MTCTRHLQQFLFVEPEANYSNRAYLPFLTCAENGKGVMDVDTVKGCTIGMSTYPNGGCYGECYALKTAKAYGFDFSTSVTRRPVKSRFSNVFNSVKNFRATWYRIGTAGDPSHDWDNTLLVCEMLKETKKTPVIITKHWKTMTDEHIERLYHVGAVVNTSTSGLDSDEEIEYRLSQIKRISDAGIKSVCRVVTCRFGKSQWASACNEKQRMLLSISPAIDTPLRARKSNERVLTGEILIDRVDGAIGGGKMVSLHCKSVYLGECQGCPDQCGAGNKQKEEREVMKAEQMELIKENVEFVYCKSVIGSGYELDVAKLAIEDGIAYRAARKNMQIHSAIILKINGCFAGFFTFQKNEECKEFCLLQSTIKPELFSFQVYKKMVQAVIDQNHEGWPMIITTDPKSKFETEALFTSMGFKTYLKMGQFAYMVHGKLEDVRMKLLAHITMTNVWNSIKGDWLRLKREWNDRIEDAGKRHGVANPKFASREGCWQGDNGMGNIVLAKQTVENGEIVDNRKKTLNGNASVLDPLACEVILRFFMPRDGRRVYNPFGGGVQFGFVAGSYGYEYISSEIRQNQCDANNRICQDLNSARWIKSDSSTYDPEGMFDLVFTCPPYYKVEDYLDYDGNPPPGELNSMGSYEQFRETLFAGYRKAIQHLNNDCFFVVMTGDSRDKNGAYYCSEAETELFFKNEGLSVYNRIVYLECEFTRLAHAKKTLNYRKFPKREQKIIVAYKGSIDNIKAKYQNVGRL